MSALAGAVANDVRGAWAATIEEEHPVVNSTERRAAPRRIAVALNDSDEARHALDWTIEHVLKEEDSLVLIYSVLSHHDHHEDHQHGEKKPSCDSAQISKGWQTLQPYQQQCKSAGIMVSSTHTSNTKIKFTSFLQTSVSGCMRIFAPTLSGSWFLEGQPPVASECAHLRATHSFIK